MAWNDLTISQRSQLMNLFRKNGVVSLSEMKRLYDLSSPSLVEATQPSFNPSAPVYAAGGPRKAGYYVYDKDDPDFIGPPKPAGFGQAPVDSKYVKLRQRYAESVFNNAAYNPRSQAKGAYQITPVAEQEYLSKTKKSKGDLYDYAYNEAIRDWYMDKRMPQMPAMHHGHPSDSVKWGIKLAGFNAGPGATNSALRRAEENGADIEGSFDWLPYLPQETQDYINFILRGKDIPGTSKTQAAMDAQAAKKGIYGCGGRKFQGGGPTRREYNGENITEDTYKEIQRQAIIDSAIQRALTRNEGIAPRLNNGELGESCIYTATDNYGRQYRVAGNQSLFANPQKYGFEVAGDLDSIPEKNIGRMYQFIDADRIPRHMGIITGMKGSTPLVTYSHGEAQQIPANKDYKKNEPAWVSPWYETYKFVGNPEDNARWSEEYNALPSMQMLPKLQFSNLKEKAHKFDMGGPGSSTGGIVPTLIGILPALKEKYLTDYANNGIVWDYPNSKKELKKYIKSPYNGKNNRFDNTIYPFYNDAENTRRAAFAKYFNLPEDNLDFTINDYIVESNYKPTISKNPEAKYYTFKNNDIPTMFDWVTGRYSATLGEDEKGKYVALYDDWDLSPFGALNTSNNLLYDAGLNSFEKFGAVPVEFYDRIYENENPKAYHSYVDEDGERRTFLRNYASGGKIHIKPENRGKFTALKKRTGHSASWFKAHGTPAQKKMAVFALNAAKWKHKKGHGGFNF